MSEYRHEYKYICSVQQLTCIRQRIIPYMKPDLHAEGRSFYTVRSLYFDDYTNRCFYDNLSGVEPREKFRIRLYDGNVSFMKLERKQKVHGMTKKHSCPVTKAQCLVMLKGHIVDIKALDNPVYRKFCIEQQVKLLKPKIIVEYDRVPYVYREGNVRVTFDMNIRSGMYVNQFLNEKIISVPVMPSGFHVLEVKFDEFLPDSIRQAIQIDGLRQTAYSKYCICRKQNIRGNTNEI
ncbi:MAG: polyphosphate polymerase domain-containing protein [Lachnospiraceae bacterium]|nr:polyphosphate polymerase domain-containing protein [Lachnospiraceae bacterium]